MITRPTVFVLGAGVSVPFGFPSGQELIHILAGNLMETGATARERELLTVRSNLVGFFETHRMTNYLGDLSEELRKSMPPSIDTWLAYRPSFQKMSKEALSMIIYAYEFKCRNHAYVKDDWFAWIFSRMLRNAKTLDDFLSNNVTFITFNYDRLLEWKLSQALEGTFREKYPQKVQETVRNFCERIMHVHGSLSYSWERPFHLDDVFGAIKFGTTLGPQGNTMVDNFEYSISHLTYASEGIKIIGEDRDSRVDKSIGNAFEKAQQIIFLGFGYDERNLEVLQLSKWTNTKPFIAITENSSICAVCGSGYGLGAATIYTIKKAFGHIDIGPSNLSAVPYCDEHVYLS